MRFDDDNIPETVNPIVGKALMYSAVGLVTVWFALKKYWFVPLVLLWIGIMWLMWPVASQILYWAIISIGALAAIGALLLLILVTIGYAVPRKFVIESMEANIEHVINNSGVYKDSKYK